MCVCGGGCNVGMCGVGVKCVCAEVGVKCVYGRGCTVGVWRGCKWGVEGAWGWLGGEPYRGDATEIVKDMLPAVQTYTHSLSPRISHT